jgi:hypothetical protein
MPRFLLIPKWLLLAAGAFLIYWIYRLVRWRLRRRAEWRQFMDDGTGESDSDDEFGIDDDADMDAWELEDEPERV